MTRKQITWAVVILSIILIIYFWNNIMNAIGMGKPVDGATCTTTDGKAGSYKNGVCIGSGTPPNPTQFKTQQPSPSPASSSCEALIKNIDDSKMKLNLAIQYGDQPKINYYKSMLNSMQDQWSKNCQASPRPTPMQTENA